ncbi:protein GRIM REAPER-like [Aristolochia californica]|uniref:protein GRIM REAPER-like n=1 Tax=Aristolochia californica TaxID=171875 RepID=UPI0035D7DC1B
MAATVPFLKLVTILCMMVIPLAFIPHSGVAQDAEEEEDYVLDNQFPGLNLRAGSRFLVSKIKKGEHCDPKSNNVCPGVSVNNGTGLLQCCKKHCRNILGDRNNCGKCGQRCAFGQLCCGGVCTNIAYNVGHCGKCNKKCPLGVRCEYGTCGYA